MRFPYSSPLGGEDARRVGEGRAASAAPKTASLGHSGTFNFYGSQTRAAPHPSPLPQGERGRSTNEDLTNGAL
jgi:hypothetical protein